MAEVVWTEAALRHLREITDYIAQRSPERADELDTQLSEAPEILAHTPRIGRSVPEFGQEHIRELVTVRPYRIIYEVRDDTCSIVAIVHSSRDLRKLRPEDLANI